MPPICALRRRASALSGSASSRVARTKARTKRTLRGGPRARRSRAPRSTASPRRAAASPCRRSCRRLATGVVAPAQRHERVAMHAAATKSRLEGRSTRCRRRRPSRRPPQGHAGAEARRPGDEEETVPRCDAGRRARGTSAGQLEEGEPTPATRRVVRSGHTFVLKAPQAAATAERPRPRTRSRRRPKAAMPGPRWGSRR